MIHPLEVNLGREAFCTCAWNGKKHAVKALLEPPELIVRGELRHRIPFAKISRLKADGDHLAFSFEGDSIRLQLGSAMAAKWAEAIVKPPPSLAKKLGISGESTVRMIGPVDDTALKAALAEAKTVSQGKGDLILARVDTPADLKAALAKGSQPTRVRHSHLVYLSQGTGASAERKPCARDSPGDGNRRHKNRCRFGGVLRTAICEAAQLIGLHPSVTGASTSTYSLVPRPYPSPFALVSS